MPTTSTQTPSADISSDALTRAVRVLLGPRAVGALKWVEEIHSGVPPKSVQRLARHLEVSESVILQAAGVAASTYHRKLAQSSRLSAEQTDRLFRVAGVFALGESVLESKAAARDWLQAPNRALGGKAPLDLLDTSFGTELVREELYRLEYGIVS